MRLNLCIYTCFVYLQPFCVTLDFKLFIDWIHILSLHYLLLWFWGLLIKNLQDFIKISRALIKDIFLGLNGDGSLKHDYPASEWRVVPLGHWYWKWNQARSNYSTYDQELLAGMLVLSSQS